MPNYLEGVIDRFEEEYAVIKLDDGQTLDWPISNLSEGLGEGDSVKIWIGKQTEETEDRAEKAKAILNELLKR
ncbi:MAG: DUF3006 domain-containing protein [Patescibacteria group bacterium]